MHLFRWAYRFWQTTEFEAGIKALKYQTTYVENVNDPISNNEGIACAIRINIKDIKRKIFKGGFCCSI